MARFAFRVVKARPFLRIRVTMRHGLKRRGDGRPGNRRVSWAVVAGLAGVVLCTLATDSQAEADTRSIQWLTGPALERALNQSQVTVRWSGPPLRPTLEKLAAQVTRPRRLAIMLDRRVDPEKVVELDVNNVTMRNLLGQLAQQQQLEIGRVDAVIYVGPKSRTLRIDELAAQQRRNLKQIPKDRQRVFLKRRELGWPKLTTPRGLVEQMLVEADVEADGLDNIPHDLWPAVRLPPLTLADRLTIVLYGFDLTFAVSEDGRRLKIVAVGDLPPE